MQRFLRELKARARIGAHRSSSCWRYAATCFSSSTHWPDQSCVNVRFAPLHSMPSRLPRPFRSRTQFESSRSACQHWGALLDTTESTTTTLRSCPFLMASPVHMLPILWSHNHHHQQQHKASCWCHGIEDVAASYAGIKRLLETVHVLVLLGIDVRVREQHL
jgi:hypothetical protein